MRDAETLARAVIDGYDAAVLNYEAARDAPSRHGAPSPDACSHQPLVAPCPSGVARGGLSGSAERQLSQNKGKTLEKTLYEKYGGFSTVSRIVMALYDRLLDDDDVGPFFDDVDMPRLIDHQTKFVASLMGGPASFSDAHIESAHRGMAISDMHFDRLKMLLSDTLGEFRVEAADVEAVLSAFEARRALLIKT